MENAHFTPGEILVVTPADQDDPVALEHAGQRCQFARYSPSGYAIVRFSTQGKPVHLRVGDLRKAEGES